MGLLRRVVVLLTLCPTCALILRSAPGRCFPRVAMSADAPDVQAQAEAELPQADAIPKELTDDILGMSARAQIFTEADAFFDAIDVLAARFESPTGRLHAGRPPPLRKAE